MVVVDGLYQVLQVLSLSRSVSSRIADKGTGRIDRMNNKIKGNKISYVGREARGTVGSPTICRYEYPYHLVLLVPVQVGGYSAG